MFAALLAKLVPLTTAILLTLAIAYWLSTVIVAYVHATAF